MSDYRHAYSAKQRFLCSTWIFHGPCSCHHFSALLNLRGAFLKEKASKPQRPAFVRWPWQCKLFFLPTNLSDLFIGPMQVSNNISVFRGTSGEVVSGFLRPRIFLTLIPVWIYWGVIGYAGYLVGRFVHPLMTEVFLMVGLAALIGRFAIPATQGDLDAGFFDFNNNLDSGDLVGFGFRYLVSVLTWALPIGGVVALTIRNRGPEMLMGLAFGSIGIEGAIVLVAVAASFIGTHTSVIIATGTTTIGEVLRLSHLKLILVERRADFVAFIASVFGGLITFCIVYSLPFAVIAYLIASRSPDTGAWFTGMCSLIPFSIAPVLIGRLAGAFVVGEESIRGTSNETAVKTILGTPSAPVIASGAEIPSGVASSYPGGERSGATNEPKTAPKRRCAFDPGVAIAKLKKLTPENLAGELAASSQLYSKNKRNLAQAYEYMLMLRRAGDDDSAVTVATAAMQICLANADTHTAAIFFHSLQQKRFEVKFDAEQCEMMAAHFRNETHYREAAWFSAGAGVKEGQDGVELQRQLIAIAEAASAAMKHSDAVFIYKDILQRFPQSNFADYVKKQIVVEEGNIASAKG